MTKRIAESEAALAEELRQRMEGAPHGYRNGDRVVPIKYTLDVEPVVEDHEHQTRDYVAGQSLNRITRSPRMQQQATGCLHMMTNAMQSDDGVGLSFMTRNERALASEEWGKRLRDLIEAGKRKAKDKAPSVIIDVDWDE